MPKTRWRVTVAAVRRDDAIAAQRALAGEGGGPSSRGAQAPLPVRAAHHGLVAALAAEAPAFAATAQLTARWLAAHLLSGMLRPEAAEVLAAAVWSHPSALPPPGGILTAPPAGPPWAPASPCLATLRLLLCTSEPAKSKTEHASSTGCREFPSAGSAIIAAHQKGSCAIQACMQQITLLPRHRHAQYSGRCRAASRTAGFHRVLALIASHPWLLRPLIVDPAREMAPDSIRAVHQVGISHPYCSSLTHKTEFRNTSRRSLENVSAACTSQL